ncbi:alkaline phosphatase family protein [Flavobacteriaceae bacterium]|nr:alkaline phosphatase family protein [Flavobacteriaceae bacterium]
MDRKVIVILDAFRWDYISKNQTPFLYNFKEQNLYIQNLVPSPGFCERSEIFTGLNPKQSGNFLAYGLKNNFKSNISTFFFKTLFLIEVFIKKWFNFNLTYKGKRINSQKIIRFFFNLLFSKTLRGSQLIPFDFFPFFELTEDKFSMTTLSEYPFNTFFDFLHSNKIKFSTKAFTNLNSSSDLDDSTRIKLLESIVSDKSITYSFLYISEIDFLGHKLGPKNLLKSKKLSIFDKKIKTLYEKLKGVDDNLKFLFIGDHGMLNVKEVFDVESMIISYVNRHNLKRGTDVIWFIDSNYFRIWFFRNKKFHLTSFQNEIFFDKYGDYLNPDKLAKFNLGSIRYGDLLWYAHNNVLLYPNFFNSTKLKGMHGYYSDSEDLFGMAIIENNKKDLIQKLPLNEIKNYF